jgi:hypothetical protein
MLKEVKLKENASLWDKEEITIHMPHKQMLHNIVKEVDTNHPVVTQASEVNLQKEEVVIPVLKV